MDPVSRILSERDGIAQIKHAATGEPIGRSFPLSGQSGAKMDFSPDGSRFVLRSGPWGYLRDTENGELIGARFGNPVMDTAFSPDGSRLLTGHQVQRWAGMGRLWDAATREPIGVHLPHREIVSAVAFSISSVFVAPIAPPVRLTDPVVLISAVASLLTTVMLPAAALTVTSPAPALSRFATLPSAISTSSPGK